MLVAVLVYHEIHVGTQHAECLVDDVAVALIHHYGFQVLPLPVFELPPFFLCAGVLGNLTYERYAQILQVLATAHFGIHILLHENDYCRNQ